MARLAAAVALLALSAASAAAGPIVVVSPDSDAAPYREALDGICEALGACPPVVEAGGGVALPPDARVVVAIGGRAARQRYPAGVILVTALTPGFEARARREEGPVVRVGLTPSPAEFARRVKASRGVRAAALLWSEPASGRFAAAARAAGTELGLDLRPVEIDDLDELPALLRSLDGVEAIWLAPDARLVTPNAFETVREYARSVGKTFFAPASGLAGPGAEPSLAPSFRACGWRAGLSAREALDRRQDPDAYADREPTELGGGMVVSTAPAAAPAR